MLPRKWERLLKNKGTDIPSVHYIHTRRIPRLWLRVQHWSQEEMAARLIGNASASLRQAPAAPPALSYNHCFHLSLQSRTAPTSNTLHQGRRLKFSKSRLKKVSGLLQACLTMGTLLLIKVVKKKKNKIRCLHQFKTAISIFFSHA